MTGIRADLPARILIVDDEPQNRRLLERMLAPEGLVIAMAASGEEAMAAVAQEPPDLILLDVMMPAMDGYSVAGRIKGSLDTKNIPIIMISALDAREGRMRALDAGAEDFLTKPVDRAELCVRVRNLLRLKACGDNYAQYSQVLEGEMTSRTADLGSNKRRRSSNRRPLLPNRQRCSISCRTRSLAATWTGGLCSGAAAPRSCTAGPAARRSDTVTHDLLKPESAAPIEQMEAALLRDGLWEGKMIHHRRDGTRLIVAIRWALQRSATVRQLGF